MMSFRCRDGEIVTVVDDDHWIVPLRWPSIRRQRFDFTRFSPSDRSWWQSVLAEALRVGSVSAAIVIWYAAQKFRVFMQARGESSVGFDQMTTADWAAFVETIKTLRPDHRRTFFYGLRTAIDHAINVGLAGVSSKTADRVRRLSRQANRGYRGAVRRRTQERLLDSGTIDRFYHVMREEWRCYTAEQQPGNRYARLPALAALWLSVHAGVRAAEINVAMVEDVKIEPTGIASVLHLHARNKADRVIPIDGDTALILQALIREGEPARRRLQTSHLFVSVTGRPRMLTTTGNGLTARVRAMLKRYELGEVARTFRFGDGRIALGSHLAVAVTDRDTVRRALGHSSSQTTDLYYLGRLKLEVMARVASVLRPEMTRLVAAYDAGAAEDTQIGEDAATPAAGTVDRSTAPTGDQTGAETRQGSCRVAAHCFECPLLVLWATKRPNALYELEICQRRIGEAVPDEDRQRLRAHTKLIQEHVQRIDQCGEGSPHAVNTNKTRRRRRRRRKE